MVVAAPLNAAEPKGGGGLKLSSPAFANGKSIPATFTCDGGDVSPPLATAGVPPGAKSLALIVDDPDAPAGVWVHWLFWNLDPGTSRIDQGKVPAGAHEGVTSWGRQGYRGPCPPSGTHRYYFRLYALNDRLDLPASATRKELDRAMQGKVLAHTDLFGVYRKK